ncbi:hypothetical protein EYR40_010378 [Pleurotus pulmonarius]|nr:hypothetical protein EYR36_010231 [Pleurotus pulmonarius]KAF4588823.1 hypothetical protein EYR40_010378 [Pleurotus pulmonarius]
MVSKPLSAALKSRDPAKALELSQYIQANAILALFSAFGRCHPDLFLDFLMPIVLPIVYALYEGFTVCLYQSPTVSFNSLVQCLFMHLPAESQLSIPDDVRCLVTLPPTRALYNTAPSSSTLRLPSSGHSHSSAAAGPVLANVGKRKHSLVEEQQTPNTEHKKMKPLAMAESKARGDRQKENIPPTPAGSIFQTSSQVHLGSSTNGGARGIPHAGIVRLALPPRTSISSPSRSTIAPEVSAKRKRPLVDEQQRETEGDKKQRHVYATANGNENIASTSARMTSPTSPEVEEAEDATGQKERVLTQEQRAKKTEKNRKKHLAQKLKKAMKKANIGSNSANASMPTSLAVTQRPQTKTERNRKKHLMKKAKKANKRLGSTSTHTTS